jgi:hypothetical protein
MQSPNVDHLQTLEIISSISSNHAFSDFLKMRKTWSLPPKLSAMAVIMVHNLNLSNPNLQLSRLILKASPTNTSRRMLTISLRTQFPQSTHHPSNNDNNSSSSSIHTTPNHPRHLPLLLTANTSTMTAPPTKSPVLNHRRRHHYHSPHQSQPPQPRLQPITPSPSSPTQLPTPNTQPTQQPLPHPSTPPPPR